MWRTSALIRCAERRRCNSPLISNGTQEAAVKIENRQQVLLIAAIAVVGLLLLDRVVLRPLSASWKARSTQIAELQKRISDGKATLGRANSIRDRWEQMKTNTLATD